MCYIKTLDGTSCLILCCPYDECVQAVEMIGGQVRWQTGVEQMGAKCYPWSICTDGDNIVYVADPLQRKLHLLAIEDGAAIRCISLRQLGVEFPLYVRAHDGYIYIGHEDRNRKKLQISKFAKNVSADN